MTDSVVGVSGSTEGVSVDTHQIGHLEIERQAVLALRPGDIRAREWSSKVWRGGSRWCRLLEDALRRVRGLLRGWADVFDELLARDAIFCAWLWGHTAREQRGGYQHGAWLELTLEFDVGGPDLTREEQAVLGFDALEGEF